MTIKTEEWNFPFTRRNIKKIRMLRKNHLFNVVFIGENGICLEKERKIGKIKLIYEMWIWYTPTNNNHIDLFKEVTRNE